MGTGVVGGGIKGGCSGPLRLISALRALRTSLLAQLLLRAQSLMRTFINTLKNP